MSNNDSGYRRLFSDIFRVNEDMQFTEQYQHIVRDVINTLPLGRKTASKIREIIISRYGLDTGVYLTYSEVNSHLKLNVSSTRVQQLCDLALRRLRHPSRSKILRSCLTSFTMMDGY